MDGGCCAPSAGPRDPRPARPAAPRGAGGAADGLVRLPGGVTRVGSDDRWAYPEDGEAPVTEVELPAFAIAAHAVSNADFARFADATGYLTDAERFGWSFVFGGLLPDDFPETQAVAAAPWWRKVEGADWRHPEGPQSSAADRGDHPVVHVSWFDARAYCAWTGTRLPREAEWEFAARGGLEGRTFPWGDELEPGGVHLMNVWQGEFPVRNTGADGWIGTAPVSAFPPNGHGLHNMTGNVWEWTADPFLRGFRAPPGAIRPDGPPPGASLVQKGGSYLCHASYCRRYRVAARQGSIPDSSTGNVGFRTARDA